MLSAFTAFHVVISLVGIGSGFVILYGLLTSRRFEGWTKVFLWTTAATSFTGFLFPYHGFKPSYVVGALSLIVLAIAAFARYRFYLLGAWRKTYIITAVIALYLNVFVLVVQSFMKVPVLRALAPTQTETPFQIVQLSVLLIFIGLGYRAAVGFERMQRTA